MNSLHTLEALQRALGLGATQLSEGVPIGLRFSPDQWIDLRFDPHKGWLGLCGLVGVAIDHARTDLMTGLLLANATLAEAGPLRLGMDGVTGQVALVVTLDLEMEDADRVQAVLGEVAQACRALREKLCESQLLAFDASMHPAWP
jgi:hypothetical protein